MQIPRLQLNWKWLAAEVFVVFFGLLAALQVDEWRENRERTEAETRYLIRLENELSEFLTEQQKFLALLNRNHAAVKRVSDSLIAGKIPAGKEAEFETGLIYVAMLPSMNLPRTTYDELIASSTLARLNSEPLKQALSKLYATHEYSEKNFSWWRIGVISLERDLAPFVAYRSINREGDDFGVIHAEPTRAASYSFERLSSSALIKNGFYWASDTHSDWVGQFRKVSDLATEALAAVRAELRER
ncbi:MAG: hypothetical protein KDI71_10580 [Xanthomonadales bacterium]|nr:hypothetical protein [Xanthomonadales bacterium]